MIHYSSIRAMWFCKEFISKVSIFRIRINIKIILSYSLVYLHISLTNLTMTKIGLKTTIYKNILIIAVIARTIIMIKRPDSMIISNNKVMEDFTISMNQLKTVRFFRFHWRSTRIIKCNEWHTIPWIQWTLQNKRKRV